MSTPADLIVRVVKAARADHRGGCAPESCGGSRLDPCPLANALVALDLALQDEADAAAQVNPGHWHPATWAEVTAGQRIRVGGQHEATVTAVVPLTWLGSGAHQVQVSLEGREHPYQMPPSGPVEVWTPSLPDWAAQAYLALAESALVKEEPRG